MSGSSNFSFWSDFRTRFCGRLTLALALLAGFFAVQSAGAYGALSYRTERSQIMFFADTSDVSQADANMKALEKCRTETAPVASFLFPNNDCMLGDAFVNTCGAIVHGNVNTSPLSVDFGQATGMDRQAAINAACDDAFGDGRTSCATGLNSQGAAECDTTCTAPMVSVPVDSGSQRETDGYEFMCGCPPNTIPNPTDPADCVTPAVCTGDLELEVSTNTCICPAGMRPASGQPEVCVPQTCGANEIRATDDTCAACDSNATADTTANTCACNTGFTGDGMTCTAIVCMGDLMLNGNRCECPSGMEPDGTADGCQFICVSPMVPNAANDGCECPAGMSPDPNDTTNTRCIPSVVCTSPMVLNMSTNMCECPSGFEPDGTQTGCRPVCSGGGVRNVDGVCECFSGHDLVGGTCVVECGANEMRNNAGICILECGVNEVRNDAGVCVLESPDPSVLPEAVPSPPKSDDANITAARAIGALFIGTMLYNVVTPAEGIFRLTPNYAFSAGGGGSSYSYGTRLDYTGDGGYSAYWSAVRNHVGAKAGVWNYAAGMEVVGGVWRFGYENRITGKKTDWEITAELSDGWGILDWRSGVVWDYRSDGFGGDASAFWRNSLGADLGNWRLMPSADFYWRGGGNLLDGGNFRLNLRREF